MQPMTLCSICWTADTARFIRSAGGGAIEKRGGFLFAALGMPCTYYGTEIGMTNLRTTRIAVRRSTGENLVQSGSLRTHYQKLVWLRKTEKHCRRGTVRFRSQEICLLWNANCRKSFC